jgi:hypothetical protein
VRLDGCFQGLTIGGIQGQVLHAKRCIFNAALCSNVAGDHRVRTITLCQRLG